jgi:hypothetical protein
MQYSHLPPFKNYVTLLVLLVTLVLFVFNTETNGQQHVASIVNGDGGAQLINPKGVFVSGSYAYVAADNGLEIVDVSNATMPVHVSQISDGTGGAELSGANSVFVANGYAYIASYSGNALEIIDITNPLQPTHAGSLINGTGGAKLSTPNSIYLLGNYAYIGTVGDKAIEIVDISNPAAPVHKGSIAHGDGGAKLSWIFQVVVSGNYLYAASYTNGEGIEVIDISDPTTPTHVSTIGASQGARTVCIAGNYAYVGSGQGSVEAFDISNPVLPVKVGSLNIAGTSPFYFEAMSMQGNYLYFTAAANPNAFFIVDVSDPSNLSLLSTTTGVTGGLSLNYPFSLYVTGSYAYVGTSGALQVINIANPFSPIFAGLIKDGSGGAMLDGAKSVFVSGNFAYVASELSNALEIIDVSNPTIPKHSASLFNGQGGAILAGPISVVIAGNYAYVVSKKSNALEIVNITNPAAPVHVGSLIDGVNGGRLKSPRQVVVSGNYAYVACYSSGLEIVDISNPAAPFNVAQYPHSQMTSVAVTGTQAYLINEGFFFKVLNVSNPLSPVLISNSFLPNNGGIRDIRVASGKNYVCITNPYQGKVLKFNMNQWSGLSGIYNNGESTSIQIAGDLAYVTTDYLSLAILDLHSDSWVQGAISHGTGGAILQLPTSSFTSGNNIYVTSTAFNALEVIRFVPITISSISPKCGKAGSTVTILGSNFSTNPGENIVRFGYSTAPPATVLTATSTKLIVAVPQSMSAGYVYVSRTDDTQIARSFESFFNEPEVTITSPTTGVYGGTIQLTADKGGSTGPLTFSVTNGSGQATLSGTTLTLTGGGTVTVKATVGDAYNYCSGSASQVITIKKADQTITFNALPDLCKNSSYTLSATSSSGLPVNFSSAYSSYVTISGNTVTGNISGTAPITASQSGNTNYNAALDVTRNINIIALPIISITPATLAICKGSSISLSASGASAYVWSPSTGLSATTGSSVVANPTATTSYTITGTATTGCVNTKTFSVQINPLTAVTINPSATGQTLCLDALPTSLTVAATGTGTLQYKWYQNYSNSNIGGTQVSTVSSSSYRPSGSTVGTSYYYVEITGTCGTAVSSPSGAITVNPKTDIVTQPSTTSQTVCQNSGATTLYVGATGTGPLTYQWYSNSVNSNASGTAISGATNASYYLPSTVVGSKYYYSKVTGSCGTVTSKVSGLYKVIQGLAIATFSGPYNVCPYGTYTYTVTMSGGDKPEYTYQWTKPSNWTVSYQNRNTVTYVLPASPLYGGVQINVSNGSCSDTDGITAYPQSCSSFRESSKEELPSENADVEIYPNPANNEVIITLPSVAETSKAIFIYSSLGSVHKSFIQKGSSSTKVNTTDFSSGLYIFQIEMNGRVVEKKVMVLH